MKKVLVFTVILLLVCTNIWSSSSTAVGTVENVLGKAQIERGTVKINAINGLSLYSDDVITTAANSVLKFSFSNKSIVTVKEGASLKISTLLDEYGKKSFLSLAFGQIAVSIKSVLGKNDSYKIQNMSAVVAVRGTVFSVTATEGTDLLVQVTKGKVEFSQDKKKLEIPAGYYAETDGDKKFSRRRGFLKSGRWLKRRRRFLKRRLWRVMHRMNRRIGRIYRLLFRRRSLKRILVFIRRYKDGGENFTAMTRRALRRELRMLRRAGWILRRLRRMMRRMHVARFKLKALMRLAGKDNQRLNRLFRTTMKRLSTFSKNFKVFRIAGRLFQQRIRQLRRYRRKHRRNRKWRRRRRFRDR